MLRRYAAQTPPIVLFDWFCIENHGIEAPPTDNGRWLRRP